MKANSFLILLFCLALVTCSHATAQQHSDPPTIQCEKILPFQARKMIQTKLSAWKIVTVADIQPDAQRLWKKKFKDQCPGIAAGRFNASPALSYAVTLVRSRDNSLYQILVVVTKTGE